MKSFSLHIKTNTVLKRLCSRLKTISPVHWIKITLPSWSCWICLLPLIPLITRILFHQFEHDFGIKGTVLQWFKSYMSGRTFRVCISGEMSESFTLDYGVPQGSIIGPRAFTKYAQHVATIIRQHGFMYHIYADDIQVYHTFDPKLPGEAACVIFKLSRCVAEIRNWMTKNKLKLNDSKTEFFIASPPHIMSRLSGTTLCIGTTEISPSATIRNLGVVFDSAMTMSPHITSLCKSLNFFLWNISRIRRFIDQETCNTTVRALVLSKLTMLTLSFLDARKLTSYACRDSRTKLPG